MTDSNQKLTAKQYIEGLRDLRSRVAPETFATANNYLDAAAKVVGAFDVETNWATIQSATELALRLFELFPDYLPLTFKQLALVEERGERVPSPNQIPDWWAGRI